MLASSLRACFHFHFNHYLVLVVLLVYSNDDDGDQRPDRAEQRAGRGNGWTNGQCSQQSTNKGQRSTTTSIKQTTNTNTKRMKNAKAKAAQKKQGFIIITFTWLHGSIAEFSRYRPITALWLRIQGHHSHNSRKRKQTHQEFMIHVEWLALEKRKKV